MPSGCARTPRPQARTLNFPLKRRLAPARTARQRGRAAGQEAAMAALEHRDEPVVILDAEQLRRARHQPARVPQSPLDEPGLEAPNRLLEREALPPGRRGGRAEK